MRHLAWIVGALALGAAAGSPAQETAPPQHSLSQFVRFSDGRAVRDATVIVSAAAPGSADHARLATTDSAGRFTIDSLLPGSYDVQVVYPGAVRPLRSRLTVDGRNTGDILIPAAAEPAVWWTIGFLLLYLATILFARWHHIARSLDEMLKGQLIALSTRLKTEVDLTRPETAELTATVGRLWTEFTRGAKQSWWHPRFQPSEFFFWSRGRENAAWVAIHEVERQLAAFMAPPERVLAHLYWAEGQLRVIDNKPATAVADAIVVALQQAQGTDAAGRATGDEVRKALLGRAISVISADRDTLFSTLMEWHNKATWLIVVALIIIGFLSLSAGHAILFLAGAAGGLLSRMMRALRRNEVPLDYGASWTTLFLSPLFGALAGWFGVAIITLATQPDINLLGAAFGVVDWNTPTGPVTLAVAFLLGFSERLFDAVVGAVEGQAVKAQAAEQAAKSSPTTAPASAPRPASAGDSGAGAALPSSAAGVKLVLPDGQITPVQTVSGKVVLEKAAQADTGVNLSTSHKDFVATPAALSIAAGTTEGDFDIVPTGTAPPGVVTVTARVGNVVVSDSIDFV